MNFRCERALSYLEIFQGGDLWLCCPNFTSAPIGNILKEDPVAVWRGPRARKIREGIAKGDFSSCKSCWYQPAPFPPIIETVADDTVPEVTRIPKLFIAFDRTCNLHCPTCRHEIWKYPWGNDREVRKLYDRVLASGVLAEVDSLRCLSSGDPFASQLCQETLRRLPWDTYPKLRLHFQTNALLFTPDRYDGLGPAKDKLVSVSVSIDAATRETYAKNRSNGNLAMYDVLQEHLKFIAGLKHSGQLETFVLVCVVQANNFREMKAFVEQAFALGAQAEFMMLSNWGTFSDEEFKARAVHFPGHPEHEEFLRVASDPLFTDPRVLTVNFLGRR